MSLDAVDTVKSAFGSLNTDTGRKAVGLLLGIQIVNFGLLLAQGVQNLAVAGTAFVGQLVIGVVSLIVTLGILRSLDAKTFSREQYTENLFWPLVRIFGANTTTSFAAFGVAALGALPAILAAGAITGAGAAVPEMVSGLTVLGALIGVVGAILGVALFVYIYVTLIASLPMVAADDRRLFESLDLSIQRTKGSRVAMFLAAVLLVLAFVVAGIVGIVLTTAIGFVSEPVAGFVGLTGYVLLSAVFSASFLSLLTEYNKRLPEA